MNCFRKCGYTFRAVIPHEELVETEEESNESFNDDWCLAAREDLDFATYVQCDSELATCGVETIESLCDATNDRSEEEDGEEHNTEPIPTFTEALLAFEKIK